MSSGLGNIGDLYFALAFKLRWLSGVRMDSRSLSSRLALKVEGLARVSKNAGGRPRLASVAFDGRYMGLAL